MSLHRVLVCFLRFHQAETTMFPQRSDVAVQSMEQPAEQLTKQPMAIEHQLRGTYPAIAADRPSKADLVRREENRTARLTRRTKMIKKLPEVT